MLNQVVLIGRIVRDLELVKKDTSKYCRLLLAVPRSFKNAEGVMSLTLSIAFCGTIWPLILVSTVKKAI